MSTVQREKEKKEAYRRWALRAAGLLIMAAIEFAGQLVALLIGLEPTAYEKETGLSLSLL